MDIPIEPIRIVTEQLEVMIRSVIALAPYAVAALVVLGLTALAAFMLGRAAGKLLRRSHARPSLVEAIVKLTRIATWVAGALIAATFLFPGLTPTNLLAGLGLGSIAIGLAFKDIFENFLAGFLILMRRPMRIGDDIECEGLSGQVERISMRDTYLRQRSGELVLLPNSFLFKNPVNILTDWPSRRISVVVGVAYGEDVDAARAVIREAVEAVEQRDATKPVQVFAKEFSASSIDFMVRWWAKSAPVEEHRSRDAVVAAIKRALDEAGIEIPFPYRTLTFKGPVGIVRERGPDEEAGG